MLFISRDKVIKNNEREEIKKYFEKENINIFFSKDKNKFAVIADRKIKHPFEKKYIIRKLDRKKKLSTRIFQEKNTEIKIGNQVIGKNFAFISGPCAVESKNQLFKTASGVKRSGATILRGGAYKPRTSPYSFQGLKETGLNYLEEARDLYKMPIITEALDVETFDLVESKADIIQIGARNMRNYSLLKKAGESDKPIMLKRGMSATIDEFLMSAEYILTHGNPNIILCERGIRTFDNTNRNTLDLAGVAILKEKTHLPVFVDPSHGTGKRELIKKMTLAAYVVGADGVMIESHYNPEVALCDGEQSIKPESLKSIIDEVRYMEKHRGKLNEE